MGYMSRYPEPPGNTGIGFHYFDDEEHYTSADLARWLPILQSLGTSWLILQSSPVRMVPEPFVKRLLEAQIEPVIRIPCHPIRPIVRLELELILKTYRRWGVHYVVIFERANTRSAWTPTEWASPGLIDRFLDRMIPVLLVMEQVGLTPVFPPLEPGGDYWDLQFMDSALEGMITRGYGDLLSRTAIAIFHFTGNRPLDWGKGGSKCWPHAIPYAPPDHSQDHRGFYRFEWIDEIARKYVKHSPAQLVIAGGAVMGAADLRSQPPVDVKRHTDLNMEIVHRVHAGLVPRYLLNTAFWLLSSSPGSPNASRAWFPPGGSPLPVAERLRELFDGRAMPRSIKPGHRKMPEWAERGPNEDRTVSW